MAESERSRGGGQSSGGSGQSRKKRGASGGSSSNGSVREVVREAAGQLQELTGRPVEAVLGIEKDGKEWAVTFEVLELERVPSTTDVLGKYEVTVDGDGDIVAAHRTRRYPRAEAGED